MWDCPWGTGVNPRGGGLGRVQPRRHWGSRGPAQSGGIIRSGGESRGQLGHPCPQKRFCISQTCQHPGSLPAHARLPVSVGPALVAPPATCCWFWGVESSDFALPVWQQSPSFVPGVTVSSSCPAAGQPLAGGTAGTGSSPARMRPRCTGTVVPEGPGTGRELCLTQQR